MQLEAERLRNAMKPVISARVDVGERFEDSNNFDGSEA
jgi:hypothetical protein